jgi:GTP cyclohydrolase II
VTSESYGSLDCDCAQQLDTALTQLAAKGRGVVFYLMQEGRGAGIAVKARDRMIVQASGNRLTTFEAYAQMGLGKDRRRYDQVAFACRLLGVTAPLELLTNNPDKIAAVEALGLKIAGVTPVQNPVSPFNAHYLAAKSRSGHALANAAGAAEAVTPPERVTYADPATLPHAPHLVHMASYLLPVAPRDDRGGPGAGPHWFHLHAYLDVITARERVVLTYGPPERSAPLVRLQPDTLLERFSLRGGGTHRRRWDTTMRAFVEHGAGCAVFVPRDDLVAGPGAHDDDADETTWLLLAHHVTGRRVRPVLGGAGDAADESTFRAALAHRGLACDAPLWLGGEG